jgi:hypothetical protein
MIKWLRRPSFLLARSFRIEDIQLGGRLTIWCDRVTWLWIFGSNGVDFWKQQS